MASYVYESTQAGVFNFSIPGQDKTVQLLRGQKVTVTNKLSGGLLRVLKLVKEIPDVVVEEAPKVATKQEAKVVDKITKVEEVVEAPVETVTVKSADVVVAVKEEEVVVEAAVVEEQVATTTTEEQASRKKAKRK